MMDTIKQWWHELWVKPSGPISIRLKWFLYFRKDVREYVRACEAQMNSKATLEMLQNQFDDLMIYGTSVFGIEPDRDA